MTLKQKREIVRRFKAGDVLLVISRNVAYRSCSGELDYLRRIPKAEEDTEQVLRDYLNGKFQLARRTP